MSVEEERERAEVQRVAHASQHRILELASSPAALSPRWHVNVPDTYTHRAESRHARSNRASHADIAADERTTNARGANRKRAGQVLHGAPARTLPPSTSISPSGATFERHGDARHPHKLDAPASSRLSLPRFRPFRSLRSFILQRFSLCSLRRRSATAPQTLAPVERRSHPWHTSVS